MNLKKMSLLAAVPVVAVLALSGCSSTSATAPAASTAAPTPAIASDPAGAVGGSASQAGAPSKEFLFSSLTADLDNLWAQDAKANAELCDMWSKDKTTVLDSLMAAKNGASNPVGVTDADVLTFLTDYFDKQCATLSGS